MSNQGDARVWLRNNGYEDVTDSIDRLLVKWKKKGKKTRRNWWDILAGGKNGIPRTVDGVEFPVLKAAQIRQGKTITKNSIKRNAREERLSVRHQARWSE